MLVFVCVFVCVRAHTHADTHTHHFIARPRVSVCLFVFEDCDESTKGQDFVLIPCTRLDVNNTSMGMSKPRVPALTWYSCRAKMRWISRVCARCPHRCVLYAKDMARAVCCRLDTAMRSQDQVRHTMLPQLPKAIPCQLCFRAPLPFLVENVLKLLPPLPISLPVLLPERQLLARRRECAAASFAGFLSGKPPLPVPVDLFAARPQHVDAVAWRQVAFVKPSGYLVCRASCRRVHL